MIGHPPIGSIGDFIQHTRVISAGWPHTWFRGERAVRRPLLPKLYRKKPDGSYHDENKLLQLFRMKAPTYGSALPVPDREYVDQWLFFAAHVGLPTRLLDWTENALAALHFAVIAEKGKPVVWMLNPTELNAMSLRPGKLNAMSLTPTIEAPAGPDLLGLTWISDPTGKTINIASENILGAWSLDKRGVKRPVAIIPTNIHPRMSVQRSCFTVHGRDKGPLSRQAPQAVVRLNIDPKARATIRRDLRRMGIDHSALFPDLDRLALELSELY